MCGILEPTCETSGSLIILTGLENGARLPTISVSGKSPHYHLSIKAFFGCQFLGQGSNRCIMCAVKSL